MAAETVTPDANVARAGMQLGRGVYTSPSTEDWAADYGWHCAIFADKAKADKVDKVHIPRRLFQEDLHHDPTRDIHHYIRQHHPGVDPARALLLAYIEQGPDLQMLIPFALLNANGGDLNLTVECADSREKVLQAIRPLVGSTTRAYYDDWARVKGELSELDDNDDWDAASDSSTDTSTQDDDAPLALLPQRRVLTLSLSPNHSERPRLVANAHSQPLQSAEAVSRLL
ncbi:hypothetical protein CDD82_5810 [Ophiocordyceps australis]|uniref:Uncharacterized protein n=1 Tax=Ophiocordyceps australis TaxID=1399860 RepID=A0A2C5YYS0_9HYPO|nr:hypothetical protein CDD82_5810 [Ophiocordyceps australis]